MLINKLAGELPENVDPTHKEVRTASCFGLQELDQAFKQHKVILL